MTYHSKDMLKPFVSRALWPGGLIHHVLDQEVAGLNPAAINYSFGNEAVVYL